MLHFVVKLCCLHLFTSNVEFSFVSIEILQPYSIQFVLERPASGHTGPCNVSDVELLSYLLRIPVMQYPVYGIAYCNL